MSKKSQPHQTQLQFVDLSSVDNRNQVREVSKSREERLHWIDIDIIRIRPGKTRPTFNWRIQGENETNEEYELRIGIPELADAIYKSGGPDDPIRGDFKDGLFYITGGERRFRALRYIRETLGLEEFEDGRKTNLVEVYQNPKGFTDADRRRIIFTSQNQLRYSPMELAYGFLEIKTDEDKNSEQIGKEYGISRQTVDNYIMLTSLDKKTQEQVDKGELPVSTALAHYRQEKKKDKDAKRVESEIPEPPKIWDKTDKEKEDLDIPPQQDNTVSSPSTRLKEEKGSAAHVYNEPEEEIWKRAIKMMSALQEQGKSVEYVIGELKLQFAIANRKM